MRKTISFTVQEECKVELLVEEGEVLPPSDQRTEVAKIQINGDERVVCLRPSRLEATVISATDLSEISPEGGEAFEIVNIEYSGLRTIGSEGQEIDLGNLPDAADFLDRMDKLEVNKVLSAMDKVKSGVVPEDTFLKAMREHSIWKEEVAEEENGGQPDADTDADADETGDADDTGDADETGDADDTGGADADADVEEVVDLDSLLALEPEVEEVAIVLDTELTTSINTIQLERAKAAMLEMGIIPEDSFDAVLEYAITMTVETFSSKHIKDSKSLKIDENTIAWLEEHEADDLDSLRTALTETESGFEQGAVSLYVQLIKEDYVEREVLGRTAESKEEVDEILQEAGTKLRFYLEILEEAEEFAADGVVTEKDGTQTTVSLQEATIVLKPILIDEENDEIEEISEAKQRAAELYGKCISKIGEHYESKS